MLKPTEKQRVVSVTTTVITTIGLLLGSIGSTLAQPPRRMLAAPTSQPTSATLSVLEDALWVCDYLATTRGSSDIATFTAVYESLKDRKFAGDFDALVSWLRQNKVAQHQILAVADSASH